jgi:hypothetical protein
MQMVDIIASPCPCECLVSRVVDASDAVVRQISIDPNDFGRFGPLDGGSLDVGIRPQQHLN